MDPFYSKRAAGALGVILSFFLTSCAAFDDEKLSPAEPNSNAFGLDESDSAEDLYFEALRLRSAGLLRRERMEQLQRHLEVVDEVYAEDPDHEGLLRKALLSELRLAAGEVRREDVPVLEAQDGRAYGRRLHRAGVKAAAQGAEGMVVVAGMLGVPTSKEEVLLMVAIPVGGYLLVKVGGMALKRVAFLLRGFRNADAMVEGAAGLGFKVQKVENASALRTAMASEDAALAEQFEEVVARIPRTDAEDVVGPSSVPVTSMRNVEVRSQAPGASEIRSVARGVEAYASGLKHRLISIEPWRRPRSTEDGRILPFKNTRTPADPIVNLGRNRAGQTIRKGKTAVRFDKNGFPEFEPKFETLIEDALIGSKNPLPHVKSANEKLFSAIEKDPGLAKLIGLTPEDIQALATSSRAPPGFRWHHHQDVGRMQLVIREEHELAGTHTGGMAIWGGGYQR